MAIEKISVKNPLSGQTELVSKKQYEKYGAKYFYNREYDRIRKSTILTEADKKQAMAQVKRQERGVILTKERISSIYTEARRQARTGTVSIGRSGLNVRANEQRITQGGRIDERSGLTMLAVGDRQRAYDVMKQLERYGLGDNLQKLHKGDYRYLEVTDVEIYNDDLKQLEDAMARGAVQMDEQTYQQLHQALRDLIAKPATSQKAPKKVPKKAPKKASVKKKKATRSKAKTKTKTRKRKKG